MGYKEILKGIKCLTSQEKKILLKEISIDLSNSDKEKENKILHGQKLKTSRDK